MSNNDPMQGAINYPELYAAFHVPITAHDCGDKCAPYNTNLIPFCCDSQVAVPTAYQDEWYYLESNTDLWHTWHGETNKETLELQRVTPPNQVLIECQGHRYCQRNFRAITCRAFPFFPYIDRLGEFIGMAHYWQYSEQCWVINHLEAVSQEYITSFFQTYDYLFQKFPREREQFRHHSGVMRRVFGRWKRILPVLQRDGQLKTANPQTGELSPVMHFELPKYGPYAIADQLRFPEERHEC